MILVEERIIVSIFLSTVCIESETKKIHNWHMDHMMRLLFEKSSMIFFLPRHYGQSQQPQFC